MTPINLRPYTDEKAFERNVLYEVKDSRMIPINEKHEDGSEDIAMLCYNLQNNQYGIVAKEYKGMVAAKNSGWKKADILALVVDDEQKEISTLICDMKKNSVAFSDNLLREGAIVTVISNLKDFIKQLNDETLHKDSFIQYYTNSGYNETITYGIVTRKFEEHKFKEAADFLDNLEEMKCPETISPLAWYKFKYNLNPYTAEAEMLRNFGECKVLVQGNIHKLEVYLLQQIDGKKYQVEIQIA